MSWGLLEIFVLAQVDPLGAVHFGGRSFTPDKRFIIPHLGQ